MALQSPPPLLFGDVAADLSIYMRAHPMMSGITIATDMKDYAGGDRYLYVSRAGGRRDRFFDNAYLVFEARGTDYDDAYDTAQAARALAWAAPTQVNHVTHVEDISGPLRMMDPVQQVMFFRFSMTFRSKGFEPA